MLLLFLLLGTSVLAQEEHFIDVRQIVKGAIDAMSRLPDAVQASQQSSGTQQNNTATMADTKKDDLTSLFKLPADIMTNLAARAGYIETPQTSTYGPWIVTRRKSSEGDNEEEGDDNSSEWVEVTEKKKKRRHKKKKTPEEEGLIKVSDLLPKVQQPMPGAANGVPVAPTGLPQMPQSDSMVAPPGTQGIQAQSHLSQLPQSPNYIYKTVVVNGETYYVPIPITQALPSAQPQLPVAPMTQPVLPQMTLPNPQTLMAPLLPQLPQPLGQQSVMQQQNQAAQVQTPQSAAYSVSQQQQQALPMQPKQVQQFEPATFPPPVNPFLGRSRAQLVSSEAGAPGQIYPPRFVRPQLRNPMVSTDAQDDGVENKAKVLMPTTTETPEATTEEKEVPEEEEEDTVVVHQEFAEPKMNARKRKMEVPLHIRTISERRSEDLRNSDDREKEESDEPTVTEPPKKKKKMSKKLKKTRKIEKKLLVPLDDAMEQSATLKSQNDVEIEMSATTLSPAPMAKKVSQSFAKELESLDSQELAEEEAERKRILKLKAEIAEGKFLHRHRRVHASKTMMMPRRIKMRLPSSEAQEDSLERKPVESEQIESMDTEEREETERRMKKTKKTKKLKKHRKHRKSQVEEELETTTEAATTTTEEPTTTEMEEEVTEEPTTVMPEKRKHRRRMRTHSQVVDGDSGHSTEKEAEKTEEVTEAPKKSHKKKRTHKKIRKHLTTTTEEPSTTTEQPSLPLKAHCLNIRSFARQFGMIDVAEFARAHCGYIENYYPELPCDTVEAYIEECERYYRL